MADLVGPGPGTLAGHMAGAERDVRRRLRDVDLVWELVDARCPRASRNPRLGRLLGGKPRVVVLCKADLASQEGTRRWLGWFREGGELAVALDALTGAGRRALVAAARTAVAVERPEGVRVMLVGIPNVGKSSLLNRMAGRRGAPTGARPGVTRGPRWVRAAGVSLLDLPGVLPPRLTTWEATWRLVAVGALSESLYDAQRCAAALLAAIGSSDLDSVARARGALRSGGELDLERAAAEVLAAFRRGRLGRHTLEVPPEAPPVP